MIINAGAQHAGSRWSFLFSVAPSFGTGPFFGLGAVALINYVLISNVTPWFGRLDQEGSARLDFPSGTVSPGVHTEDIFSLQSPAGAVGLLTKVIPYDT